MLQSLKFISRFNLVYPLMTSLLAVSNNININPSQTPIVVTSPSSLSNTLKVALCQVKVDNDKQNNIQHVKEMINKITSASLASSDLIVLPECWNSPYSTASFPIYAESVPDIGNIPDNQLSPSIHMLCNQAKEKKVWIIGGSIPERDVDDKLYNTCVIINDTGDIVGKHRKVHLFDIDVPGKITFKESDSLSPGQSSTVVSTPWGNIGVGICYDIRFPEYAMLLREKGARILVYPGAFNMVTGPAHWELLQRSRAVDNQVYVISCSPARNNDGGGGYVAWGHSSIVNPWGEVVATTDADESIIYAELQLDKIDEMRQGIPCWKQKRNDLYKLQFD